jgi:PAS domain S-box-containing protein
MPTRVNNTKLDRGSASSGSTIPDAQIDLQWSWIFDRLPEAISIHTLSGEIAWANKELCDLYQKPLSELKGLSYSEVFHEPGLYPHEQVLSTGQSVRMGNDLNVSGKIFSVTLEPLFDESNQQCGFVRVMRDVTGERYAQEQLIKAERYATFGKLFSAVAHDVGTPLNVISGYAEFLLMRKNSEEQGYKELRSILDQTRRIAAMLGQALEMSRPRQARTSAVDLNTLVTESLTLVGHHLRNGEVIAGITCTIANPLIYGEASQLKQAFFNLLLNAGEGVGAGGRLQVVIDQTAEMPGFLRLDLLGTDKAGAEHDFSVSLGGSLTNKGGNQMTGIGMHLARNILVEAGARICFSSGSEEGLGLVIYLPKTSEY